MKQSRLFLSAVLALVLGLTSWASAASTLDDEAIRTAVENKLDQKDIKNGEGPWVAVENGTVTVRGTVASFYERQVCVSCCQHVPGVFGLLDEIKVDSPVSKPSATERF